MDQKWIRILTILVFYQQMAPGVGNIQLREEERYEIKCDPGEMYSTVMWFRVLDKSGFEFIASFDAKWSIKSRNELPKYFYTAKEIKNTLTITSFRKVRDSGLYSCAFIKNNILVFGPATRLRGVEVPTKAPAVITTRPTPPKTTTPCVCKINLGKKHFPLCAPIILAPLAGGCGLLLLLLIIAVLYCNHVRTRRCPHHYKRKPRTVPPENLMMAKRYV
ncbi:T-cell surface glycoprotein CD8 alpha chain [Echeneis naucrates]|uniref:T-cell surface glycoprotein CD8 alpha chain-like n=1 Tax=Echeneis naucrates TaxID=173247 RepID=A0A665TIM7_ECHNA|nr:T-cell surface glycoprotein CD8 alpha chain-like [Echeneis naucrates]